MPQVFGTTYGTGSQKWRQIGINEAAVALRTGCDLYGRSRKLDFSAARGWRGAGRQNLRVFRIGVGTGIVIGLDLLPSDEPNGGGPGGKEICAGNEFGCEGWQESPVPSEETNQNEGYNQIEQRVCGGYASFDEERKGGDLEGVGSDGHGPCQAVLGRLQRFEVIEEAI